MIIISDTTPLSELAKVGYLNLLRDIYGVIIIPSQVYDELIAAHINVVVKVPQENWIQVQTVRESLAVLAMQKSTKLGLGESGVLALAKELNTTRLLIDDLAARKEAQSRGFYIIGTAGVLLIAKQLGLLSNIKNVLDDLIVNGMRISPRLYQQVLDKVGE